MADIFDRLGSALEDVKDTFVEQAPLILPIALNILAPGMGTIAASTLLPFTLNRFAQSTIKILFFVAIPINTIKAI